MATEPLKPTETQGPCPDLRGFCIKALTVISYRWHPDAVIKTHTTANTSSAPFEAPQQTTEEGTKEVIGTRFFISASKLVWADQTDAEVFV